LNKTSSSAKDLEQQGMKSYESGQWTIAAERFREAQAAYKREGNESKSAEMANNLCVTLLQDKRPKEALAAVEGTWDVFLTHGDELRAAQAYGNLASAREACGDAPEAEEAYRRAAQLLEKAGAEDARAQTLAALSRLQLKRGQPLEAIASMQSGLEGAPRLSFGKRLLRKILDLPRRFLGP
jgi:tetratricopeptide (TPR) repeat protein